MAEANGQRWLVILTTGVAIFSMVGTFMALNNDPGTKLGVAAILLLSALWLGFSGLSGLLSKPGNQPAQNGSTPPAPPSAPASPPSLENKEDAALLQAAGYFRSDYFPHRWEKHQPDADAPFEETAAILYDDQGSWETSASVFLVLNDCAWAPGSAKSFKNRNDTPCRLETLLSFPEFKKRLSLATNLVFVGMESYLNAPKPASSSNCGHGTLTACRADRLITRTYNEYFSDDTKPRPELWELDIGYANSKSPEMEWNQRRAVILGIRNRRPGLSVDDAITKVATGAKAGVVKLWEYSKAPTARARHIPYSAWSNTSTVDAHG